MLKGLGDGDAIRSYQSIEPFYEEGDYSACQRLLILEELESGLGEWEYGAEIYFVLEACWLCNRMSAQTDACMMRGAQMHMRSATDIQLHTQMKISLNCLPFNS